MRKLLLDSTALIVLRDAVSTKGTSMLESMLQRGFTFATPLSVLRESGVLIDSHDHLGREGFIPGTRFEATIQQAYEKGRWLVMETPECVYHHGRGVWHGMQEHAGEKAVHWMGELFAKERTPFIAVCDDGDGACAMMGSYVDFRFGSCPPLSTPAFATLLQQQQVISRLDRDAIITELNKGREIGRIRSNVPVTDYLLGLSCSDVRDRDRIVHLADTALKDAVKTARPLLMA